MSGATKKLLCGRFLSVSTLKLMLSAVRVQGGKILLITISDFYLIEMLTDSEFEKKDSAVKCLEVLSTSKPEHWKSILEAG